MFVNIFHKITKKNTVRAPIVGFVGAKRKSRKFSCKKCNLVWIIKNGKRNKNKDMNVKIVYHGSQK